MKITSKDLSLIAIFASLYAVLVYLLAPISFYVLQFRVAGIIRPAIAKKWVLAIGYTIGVVVGNLFSPFVGIYELLFMPIMSFIAGILGYILATKFNNNYLVTGIVIATIIPLSVSWMLNQVLSIPLLATLPYLFISEQIVCFLGSTIFKAIEKRYVWW
ncbi:MAG: QueT transporter family protein [Candidatus Bathyarchaeota archaeon]|nr:QueT transporter family protein [Candidatus Bathyarchaeota archaeon]